MERAFKMVMKIFLLLTGSVMLLGGGICAASNVFFMLANISAGPWFILLFGISCLIGWAGWWAIKFSGIGRVQNLNEKVENGAAKDMDAN